MWEGTVTGVILVFGISLLSVIVRRNCRLSTNRTTQSPHNNNSDSNTSTAQHHQHQHLQHHLHSVRTKPRQIMAHKFNCNNFQQLDDNSNSNSSNASPSSVKGMQQKHLRPLQLHQIAAATVIFGLLFTCICVSGQIDGYEPGVDYPTYDVVPKGLSFKCQGRTPGYYADTETRCQVWHWCLHSGHQYSFICPNGTVFNQAVRVCDWWSNVNCPASEQLYENNDELYRTTESSNGENTI